MLALLFVTASLLGQATLFRNIENWEVNSDVTLAAEDPDPTRADAASSVWAAESDSSRIAGTTEAR
jgi:hypothetical protein